MAKNIKRIFLALIALILVAIIAIEGGGRYLLSRSIESSMGEESSISFGSSSLTLAFLSSKVQTVEITTPDSLKISYPNGGDNAPEINGSPATHITLTGMHFYGSQAGIADHVQITTTLSDNLLLAMVQQAIAQSREEDTTSDDSSNDSSFNIADITKSIVSSLITVSAVSTDEMHGTVTIQFTNGLASLSITPSIEDGQLTFTHADVSLLGMNISNSLADSITNSLQETAAQINSDLKFTNLKVTNNGVMISLEGDNINLSEASSLSVDSASSSQAE